MQATTQVPKVPDIWKKIVAPYQTSDIRTSLFQLLTSVAPYLILFYLMVRSLEVSYWLTLALAIPTAGFGIRMFIVFHDAGHGSFFPSKTWNTWIGRFTGLLLFTPYYAWRHSHAVHHASAGDLDRRGIGDVWTLTKDEFYAMPKWKQIGYRIYRNPFIMFGIGPVVDFVILQRIITKGHDERERASIFQTNIALLILAIIMSLTIGFDKYVLVQLPIIALAGTVGVWLFYVQHQYENVYWERHEDWDYAAAALYGSSFYRLPKVLQWFTGNIGFHHIHHLSPRIPNYKLEDCHNADPLFQTAPPLTLWTSLKSLNVRLWDEDRHKMVGYHPHHHHDDDTEETGVKLPAPERTTP
jgi:acyl-lipid omega-6 desaturase (Delta-12 desaturase)